MSNQKTKRNTAPVLTGLLLLALAVLALALPASARDDQPGHDGRQDGIHGHHGHHPHPNMHEACLQLEGTNVCLYSTCQPGETYCIEATTSLEHPQWAPVCSSTVSQSGHIEFTDTCCTNYTARFYRVVWTADSGNNGKGKQK